MSYDITLRNPVTKEPIDLGFTHQMAGGTYCVTGTSIAELNVTYNYCQIFQRVLGDHGIRAIYGMTGAESIPLLNNAINALADDADEDYWKATEGNAKQALSHILAMAQLRPDGVWDGD